MSEHFIEELDLKELTSFGQVEISVANDMSRIKHKVCGKVWNSLSVSSSLASVENYLVEVKLYLLLETTTKTSKKQHLEGVMISGEWSNAETKGVKIIKKREVASVKISVENFSQI